MPEATKFPPVTLRVSMFTVPDTVPPLVESLAAKSVVRLAIVLCAIEAVALTDASTTEPAVGVRVLVSAALFANTTACRSSGLR